MADRNSLERCLTSLEKTLKSRTGLPLLKKHITDKKSGREYEDLMVLISFLETCLLILSDETSDADKFLNAKTIAEEEGNRVRHKVSIDTNQLTTMLSSEDIMELETTVRDVFDLNTVEDSPLHRAFIAFRDDALTQRSLCGLPKKEKKKDSCELS